MSSLDRSAAADSGAQFVSSVPLETAHGSTNKAHKGEDRVAFLEAGDMLYLMVADGHGGPHVAERASTHLLGEIASEATDETLQSVLRASFLRLHEETQNPQYATAGATLTVVAVNRRTWHLTHANVGDSSAYLVLPTDGVLPASADHRLETCPEERDRVEQAGGKIGRAIHPVSKGPTGPMRAWPGGLAMGRSIGDADCGAWVSCEPSIGDLNIPPDGGWVVLASDGVWDAIGPEAVAKVLRQGHPPGVAAERVAAAAIKARGLRDDTSCIVCMLGNPVTNKSPGSRGFSPFHRRRNKSGEPLDKLDRSGHGADGSCGASEIASSGSSDSLGIIDDQEITPPGGNEIPAPGSSSATPEKQDASVKGGRLFHGFSFTTSPKNSFTASPAESPDASPLPARHDISKRVSAKWGSDDEPMSPAKVYGTSPSKPGNSLMKVLGRKSRKGYGSGSASGEASPAPSPDNSVHDGAPSPSSSIGSDMDALSLAGTVRISVSTRSQGNDDSQ